MHEVNVIITIAYRDVLKFLRDKPRIFATFAFPFIFLAVLGGSFQANLGAVVGFNFMTFVFTGIVAQTLFQSSAAGIISLVEDRENDFSQELFVSPVSRYSIIIGKIIGEGTVAYLQVLGVIFFALLIRVPVVLNQLALLLPAGVVICLLGGAFGVLVMSQLSSQKVANQVFPFLLFPQFFLAGVFSPIKNLPLYLLVLSRVSPMTYAVDFVRAVYYFGTPEYSKLIIFNPAIDLGVMLVLFGVMISLGTYFFVKNERDR